MSKIPIRRKQVEEWKTIEEAPNYSVSNWGQVRNDKFERLLSPIKGGGDGEHLYVQLYLGSRTDYIKLLLARLVARYFLPNPDNLPEVDHKDQDPTNNYMGNLRWSDDELNSINRGKFTHHRGEAPTSRFRGVFKRGQRWIAQIKARMNDTDTESKYSFIGSFDTEEQAAEERYQFIETKIFSKHKQEFHDKVYLALRKSLNLI